MNLSSNFDKFKLLLWKDWLLQWNHKFGLWLEIFLPILFVLVLVWVRNLIDPAPRDAVIYTDQYSLTDLSYTTFTLEYKESIRQYKPDPAVSKELQYHMAYSPDNPIFRKIVVAACGNLNLTYSGHRNSKELLRKLLSENIFVGVEFPDSQAGITTYPRRLRFKLRFPSELRTPLSTYIYTWETNNLYPIEDPLGPRNRNQPDGGEVNYITEGFVSVQFCITSAYILLASTPSPTLPRVVMQRYPYPEALEDPLLASIGSVTVLVILLSYIYPATYTVKSITLEKEKQLKEVMKIMGLSNWLHWVAWFARSLIVMAFSTLVMVFCLTFKWRKGVAVYTFSSFTAVYFFFIAYVINTIFFCFMLATMFSRANTAAAITGLLWFVTYLPFIFIDRNYQDLSKNVKILLSLSCNTAMGLGAKIIQIKELEGVGLQWDNMFAETSPDDALSLSDIYVMMIISSIIYMLVCLYLEQVFPGEYGLPKPWNFPFKKSFWMDTPEETAIKFRRSTIKFTRDGSLDDEFDEVIGIEIRHLYKVFGEKVAVNNLSLNMYQNEITVLLGHNGAGKTTTIMILTGMMRPTQGTAIINGFDIKEDMEGARLSLGICPQHNVLFDDLTVKDHLIFFSRLKGMTGDELDEEVDTFIRKVGLESKADLISSKLSGGMKRKLSICTAFCGGTKVVLCDEPSSGLDPAARRKLWEFIQAEKRGRTILLTTHFMDEAEVLGDHIAIMRGGVIQAYGTSFSLKKKFGDGYKLICEKDDGCSSIEVTRLLSRYIPGISPSSDIGGELSYILPEEHSPKFSKMLQELESKHEELHLNGYGISLTSLEDVFLKVGAEVIEGDARHSIVIDDPEKDVFQHHKLKTGSELQKSQWRAMLFKKFVYTKNTKTLFIIQNIIPLIFIVCTLMAVKVSVFSGLTTRDITLADYPSSVTCLELQPGITPGSTADQIADNYEAYVDSIGGNHQLRKIRETGFANYIMDRGRENQPYVDRKYLAAATISPNQIVAWFNNEAYHTAPLSVNIIGNAMARAFVGQDSKVDVTNDPLPYSTERSLQILDDINNEGTQIALNVSFGMAFVSAFYVLFLVTEYETRAKLLQFVAGVRVYTFWLSHFLWDLVTFFVTAFVVTVCLIGSRSDGYDTIEDISRYVVILFFFALSSMWFVYMLSYFFDEAPVAFSRLTVFFFFTGNACMLIVIVLGYETIDLKDTADIMRAGLLFFPHFSMAIGFVDAYKNSLIHSLCDPYMQLEDEIRCSVFATCCKLESYYSWEEPGILQPIAYLAFTAVVFGAIVILREYRMFDKIWLRIGSRFNQPPPALKHDYYEEDVEMEKERIAKMEPIDIVSKNLVVDRLTKNFGQFIAVNGISFAVERQQCFGLLGVNGAGKTTTFKMLTGDEKISSGDAYVTGTSMTKNLHRVYQKIGYCPQFDALFDDFTGEEMLVIFALLRGVPDDKISVMIEEMAHELGFTRHLYKKTGTYSGGNKRKLSVALAAIGNPIVVYLDEPTTGMDPAARRRFWGAIGRIRDSGKSIVLTSHSMEECEALCTRLAIMVNGELKCIGSTQHLKNKYSKGIILKVQLKHEPSVKRKSSIPMSGRRPTLLQMENADARDVTLFLQDHFPDSYLQDRYRRILTYYITVADIRWSELFDLLENNKDELNIEDYTISQTTLEEIFLQIAMYQANDPREARLRERQRRPSAFKKMMSSTSFARSQ